MSPVKRGEVAGEGWLSVGTRRDQAEAAEEAFRAFMGPFAEILTRSKLLAAFGDDNTAVLMYDTDTVPVKGAPGAECLKVVHGRIAHMRIIFDRAPFEAARQESVKASAADDE